MNEPTEATLWAMVDALFVSSAKDFEATDDEMRPVFEVARAALAAELLQFKASSDVGHQGLSLHADFRVGPAPAE